MIATSAGDAFPGEWTTPPSKSEKPVHDVSIKQLLGEMYPDRAYLTTFHDELTHQDVEIGRLVDDAIQYLDVRALFWSQQRPLYSRKEGRGGKRSPTGKEKGVKVKPGREMFKKPAKPVSPYLSVPKEVKRIAIAVPKNTAIAVPKHIAVVVPKHIAVAVPKHKSLAVSAGSKPRLPSKKMIDDCLGFINSSLQRNDYSTGLRKTKALMEKLDGFDMDDGGILKCEIFNILSGIHCKMQNIAEAIVTCHQGTQTY